MNFKIGDNIIGKFHIWINETSDTNYFDILVHEHDEWYPYYISLHKDNRFHVEYKFPPKPIKIKKKKDKFGEESEEEVPETEAEQIYRIEHYAYDSRKEMSMPLWKLHKTTLERVVENCHNL